MDRRTWHKTFRNTDQMMAWAEKHDAEIMGTRDLEQARHHNLSPARQGVAKGLTEMDKSQTPPGRDTGPRSGPEKIAKPITKEKMVKHALDTLSKSMAKKDDKKKDVKESDTLMIKLKRALIREGRVKELVDDLKTMSDADFMKKYGKAKTAIRRDMKRVDEAEGQTVYTKQEIIDMLTGKKTQQQVDAERAQKPLKEVDAPAMPAAPAAPAAPAQPAVPAKAAATTPVAAKPAGQQPFKPTQVMDPQQTAAANKAAQEFMAQLTAKLQGLVSAQPTNEQRLTEGNWLTDKLAAAVDWVKDTIAKNPLIEIGLRLIPSPAQPVLAILDVIQAVRSNSIGEAVSSLAKVVGGPAGQQLAQAAQGINIGSAVASGDIAGAATQAANAAGLKDVSAGIQTAKAAASGDISGAAQTAANAAGLKDVSAGIQTAKAAASGDMAGAADAAGLKNVATGIKGAEMVKALSETAPVTELSTNQLARYKTAAAKDAKQADKAGDFKRGDKRLSGMVAATKKQFDNDAKKVDESRAARRALMAQIVNYR